jgi:hypothetical protein
VASAMTVHRHCGYRPSPQGRPALDESRHGGRLARCGQGYLLSDDGLHAVAYGMLPPLTADSHLPRKDQRRAKGLRLYETFVAG